MAEKSENDPLIAADASVTATSVNMGVLCNSMDRGNGSVVENLELDPTVDTSFPVCLCLSMKATAASLVLFPINNHDDVWGIHYQ